MTLQIACRLLAQSLAQSDDTGIGDVLLWVVVFLLLISALVVAVIIIRKRLAPDEDFHGAGFSLMDLRQMHKAGRLTDEELSKAKGLVLQSIKDAEIAAKAAPPPKGLSGQNDLPRDK